MPVDHHSIKETPRKRKTVGEKTTFMFLHLCSQHVREIHAKTLHYGEFSRSIANVNAGQERLENKR